MVPQLPALVFEESQNTMPEFTSYALWADHEKLLIHSSQLRLVGAQWVMILCSVIIQIKKNPNHYSEFSKLKECRSSFGVNNTGFYAIFKTDMLGWLSLGQRSYWVVWEMQTFKGDM